ncbi:MAG TPA: prolyl aminopeptidase [Burkholderiales bacterium]
MDQDPSAEEAFFPEIEPYRKDWLAVDAGHRIYFEESGNPRGYPVVFLHGGPGSRTRPAHRRFFDPQFYRIVLFDQRGCGLSTPGGSTDANTIQHLVADVEQLRRMLGVQRWLLFGGSWGSTLALAYAIAHTESVAGLILRGVFLGSPEEIQWYLCGMRRFIPEAWTEFAAEAAAEPLARYHELVNHPDAATALAAARKWHDYEARMMGSGDLSADTGAPPADELLARARVQLHYLARDCFLRPGQLIDNLWRLAGLPAIIVQGRMDVVCPPLAATEVARRLPRAELQMVAGAGHSASQPAIASRLCAATRRMRSLLA